MVSIRAVWREVVGVTLDGQAGFAEYARELQAEVPIRKEDNAQAARS
jgi:hypothetical protein